MLGLPQREDTQIIMQHGGLNVESNEMLALSFISQCFWMLLFGISMMTNGPNSIDVLLISQLCSSFIGIVTQSVTLIFPRGNRENNFILNHIAHSDFYDVIRDYLISYSPKKWQMQLLRRDWLGNTPLHRAVYTS